MSYGLLKQGIFVALVAWMLTACGGGGGGGDGPPPPPPPPQTFTLGGSISGLVGSVVLRNADGAQFTVSANGTFTLGVTVAAGARYDVIVAVQPELQTCTVANGSGTAAANVTNIAISCIDAPAPILSLSLLAIKTFRFAWNAVPGITHYKLLEDPTGSSGFAQVGADTAATVIEHVVPLHLRVNARYKVQACAGKRCIDSNEVSVSGPLAEAVGYFKASSMNTFDQFGRAIALSADGTTLAVGVPFEDSSATGSGGDPDNDSAPESGAVYVFVREGEGASPVWVQQAYIKASNTDDRDVFGHSVALDSSGSTLAVGAPGIEDPDEPKGVGSAYVFERSNGVWTEQQVLEASNAGQGDEFGYSLALSGDGRTLAVGARFEDSGAIGVDGNEGDGTRDAGAVYVFVKEDRTWLQDAYVKASNTGADDEFGFWIALSRDGTTLAVGAPHEDSAATGVGSAQFNEDALSSGAVYVFTHAGVWAQQAYIKASNTGVLSVFGWSIALSADGSTLAVGAQGEANATGAAYVFVRLGEIWMEQAYIKASHPRQGDSFGYSLALSADGSTLAVGADHQRSSAIGIDGNESDFSALAAGAVYVFERSNDVWAQRAFVKPSNTAVGYLFGHTVALSGDGATLAAGASSESGSAPGINGDQSSPPILAAGAVYLY